MKALQPSALHSAAHSLKAEATARRVIPALVVAGVDPIVLKGPALAAWLYPGEELRRTYGDLDLLVRPDLFATAADVLGRLGYARKQGGWDELSVSWEGPEAVIDVDLHRGIVGAGAAPADVWAALSAHRVDCELLGERVGALDPAGLAMHAATHAAQHGLDRTTKPLADLERAIEIAPPGTWEEAAAVAASIDATPAFVVGLRMCAAGESLIAGMDLPEVTPIDVALRAESNPPPLVLGIEQLRRLPGSRSKAAFAASKLFPPETQMRSTSALARRGPAGLAIARAAHPLVALVRLPGAVRRHRALSQTAQRAQHVDDE